MSVRDTILALVKELRQRAKELAAEKTESQQQFQEVVTELEAFKKELEEALKDDASGGSSTGGGSGAQIPAPPQAGQPGHQQGGLSAQQAAQAASGQRPGASSGR